MAESVPSVLESDARGDIADIYADIRKVLGTSVVNLIWRNLATMPGALEWTWSTVRPLYRGDAPLHAEAVRATIALPDWPAFSADTLLAAGVDEAEQALIRNVLDSYQHTNALALVVLSALLAHYEPQPADAVAPAGVAPRPSGARIPELPPMDALDPEVAALVGELNTFGEDTEPKLIASMYRHLAYWPAYLALVRTMLAPLQRQGRLNALTQSTRALGHAHGTVPPVRRTSDRPHDRNLRADPAGDRAVTEGAVLCFDAFSLREPLPTPDQVRGGLSLENALYRAASSGHQPVDEQHDDSAHDGADDAGAFSRAIPSERLAKVARHERADDSQNGRQNEAGRLVVSRHDELRNHAHDETDDDRPDDAHCAISL
jgi:hypothetical protein